MISKKQAIVTFVGALLVTASPMAIAASDKVETIKGSSKTSAAVNTQTKGQIKADNLIGADIHNAQGEDIGDVEGIILDKDGGTAAVIVGVGGFLGIGEREVAIKWDDLTFMDNGDKVTVDMSKAQLKALPEYKFKDDKYRRTSFYDRNYRGDSVVGVRDRREAMNRDGGRMDRKYRSVGFGPAGELRTTSLIGAEVMNAQNEEIGEVEEVLIGKTGELQAVLSIGGFLGMGDHEVAVDWDQLKVVRERDDRDELQVRLNMNKETLKKMPKYDRRLSDRK